MGESLLIPNSTQIPNVALDILLPLLHEAEARCLFYIMRRTYGFHRESDQISLSQFVSGITRYSQEGILDLGTGLSRQAVITALANLVGFEMVERQSRGVGRGHTPTYSLNLTCEIVKSLDLLQHTENAREKMVNRLDLLRNSLTTRPILPTKGQPTRPERVNLVDPQKKGKLSKKETKNTPPTPSQGEAHAQPTTSHQLRPKSQNALIDYSPYPGFLRLWAIAVPRQGDKGSKKNALTEWLAIRPNPEIDQELQAHIVAAYASQKRSPKWQEQRGIFAPELHRWLHHSRWEGVEVEPEGDEDARLVAYIKQREAEDAQLEAHIRERR